MFTTDQIALQLYTLRDVMATDFMGTLGTVADAGYPAVEFARYGSHTAAEVRTRLDEVGLRTMGAHTPFAALLEDFEKAAGDVVTVGGQYLIVPGVPKDEYLETPDQVRRLAGIFNGFGAAAQNMGLTFLYHNHDFELRHREGWSESDLTALELLLHETDPALVNFELDVFWAEVAGRNSEELIRAWPGRFTSLHVKDMDPAGEDAPVGTGRPDWRPIFAAAEEAGGTRWLVVEQDNPRDPLVDIRTSIDNLRTIISS
jgi:sugar phosphate isomerase/epimerase